MTGAKQPVTAESWTSAAAGRLGANVAAGRVLGHHCGSGSFGRGGVRRALNLRGDHSRHCD